MNIISREGSEECASNEMDRSARTLLLVRERISQKMCVTENGFGKVSKSYIKLIVCTVYTYYEGTKIKILSSISEREKFA